MMNYDSNSVAKTTTSIQTHYPLTLHYLLLQKFASPAFLLISTCRRFLQVCWTAAWKDGEPLLRLGILMITHGERKERKKKTWDWTVTWREMQQLEHMLISVWNQNKRAAYLWRTVCLRDSSLINNIVTSTGGCIERNFDTGSSATLYEFQETFCTDFQNEFLILERICYQGNLQCNTASIIHWKIDFFD